MTRILARRELEMLLEPADCIAALREGFREIRPADAATAGQRIRTDLPFPGTATALIPGLLPDIEAYTVKVNAKFPDARPALRGVICLHSGRDGELLALLDSAVITAWRTGLAAALGTDLLAGPDPDGDAVLGIIGAGAQAELMVRGLHVLRQHRQLVVYDIDARRAADFAARHGGRAFPSSAAVAATADIILMATWSRTPLLRLADTRPGQHITSLGADEPGKQELAADLLTSALLVVDDRELAAATGALSAAGLPGTAAHTTLGELVRCQHPGRTSPTTRTIYAPVGLPWQDLALSWLAFRRAERADLGITVDFLH